MTRCNSRLPASIAAVLLGALALPAQSPLLDAAFRERIAASYPALSELEPPLTAGERSLLLRAINDIAGDKLGQAASALEGARGPGASAVIDFTLGNVRFQQEQADAAAAAYAVAVEKFPRFRRAWANLGQAHFRRSDFAAAARALAKVVELGGNDAVTFGLLGIAHSRTENHVAAESAFRMAAMLAPETLDWQMGLAETFFRQERFTDAVALFGSLIRRQPDRADLWLAQGEAQARAGQPLAAAKCFEVVDRLGSGNADSLLNLGDIYANQGLWDLALTTWLRSLQFVKDGSAERLVRGARYLVGNGAHQEGRAMIDAIERSFGERLAATERKDLLRLRARLAAATAATAEEAAVLQEIVELDPLDGEALLLLGQHSSRAGDQERAAFWFERAAGLPEFEADAKVRLAQVLVGQGRYPDALAQLRRAQALKPRDNVAEYLQQVERVSQGR